MSFPVSLYDALVSIAVPADKARAVVDAMEHDMGTTLATKSDLENLRLATKSDLENLRLATKSDLENLRQATKTDLDNLRLAAKQDFRALKDVMDVRFALVDQKFETLELRLVVKLGSLMAAGFGLTIAALRLWA
jgi:hypothetical protein